MDRIRRRLGFSNKLYVDCEGEGKRRIRGLTLFWKGHVDLALKSWSLNHKEVEGLGSDGKPIWRLMGIYGFPDDEDKPKTWDLIRSLNNAELPWLCFADFTEILVQDEKQVGPPKSQALLDEFQKVVLECDPRDLGFTGYRYTWSNYRGNGGNVQEPLDCFFARGAWLTIFPWNRVRHLPK